MVLTGCVWVINPQVLIYRLLG